MGIGHYGGQIARATMGTMAAGVSGHYGGRRGGSAAEADPSAPVCALGHLPLAGEVLAAGAVAARTMAAGVIPKGHTGGHYGGGQVARATDYRLEVIMTEQQTKVLELIAAQQKTLGEYDPARMVGYQLADICRAEPESAALICTDLEGKGMGLVDAAGKIKAKADEIHRKSKGGGGVAVPPWIAEDVLRAFYGLPERVWGPGREPGGDEGTRAAGGIPKGHTGGHYGGGQIARATDGGPGGCAAGVNFDDFF